jgi:acetyl esterase/lipase
MRPVAAQETPATAVPLAVEHIPDVPYSEVDGTTLLLDVFRPPMRDAPRPGVVVLYGGGLTRGSRVDVVQPATDLARAGYVAFAIDYRLFNEASGLNPWPAQLDDAQRAVRWIRANADSYGVDPKRVGSYGHSAGGHLAALLGVSEADTSDDAALAGVSSRVTCVVDLAGDTDFVATYDDPEWTEFVVALLGGTPEEAPQNYRSASPLHQVDEDSAPFLVIHGARDFEVPVEQSRRLVQALHEAGVEVAYLELPNGDHAAPAWWVMTGPWILTFLGVHLHPER